MRVLGAGRLGDWGGMGDWGKRDGGRGGGGTRRRQDGGLLAEQWNIDQFGRAAETIERASIGRKASAGTKSRRRWAVLPLCDPMELNMSSGACWFQQRWWWWWWWWWVVLFFLSPSHAPKTPVFASFCQI